MSDQNMEAMDTGEPGVLTDGERMLAMDEDQFKTYIKNLIVDMNGDISLAGNHQASPNSPESDRYNFDHPRRGLAIIYNNENFQDNGMLPNRVGSSEDAANLKMSFELLGFDVLVFKDFPAKYMPLAAKEVARLYNHKEADCFACAILSHGMEVVSSRKEANLDEINHVVYGYDNSAVFCEDIVNKFKDDNCGALKDKPRLFFLQACRGDEFDSGVGIKDTTEVPDDPPVDIGSLAIREKRIPHFVDVQDAEPTSDEVYTEDEFGPPVIHTYIDRGIRLVWRKRLRNPAEIRMLLIPMYTDTLIMYATPPGYFAWRRDTGSWFITELCNFLQSKQVQEHSLLRGLSSVSRQVILKYKSQAVKPYQSNKLGMPTIDTMLTKDLIMTPKGPDIHMHTQ